ncbi:hypothetical protein [Metarhizobium album]|nr:hypothetical protein [Rhizobium album]
MNAIHVTPMTPLQRCVVDISVLRLRAVEVATAAGILFWLGWHAAASF